MATAPVGRDIQAVISELCDLLETTRDYRWKKVFSGFLDRLDEGGTALDRQSVIRQMLRLYGGMGSFNDLVLQDSHGVLPENNELDRLRHELHERLIQDLK